MKTFPNEIIISDEPLALLKIRRNGTAIYVNKDQSLFTRYGEPSEIKKELEIHKELLKYHFPVPGIINEGKEDSKAYFQEKSLGSRHFWQIFTEEKKRGEPKEQTLDQFLRISVQFATAQLGTLSRTKDWHRIFHGVHLDSLFNELPDQSILITKVKNQIEKELVKVPIVLSHGDLNPYNVYPKGVIDFEDHFYAPLGYDLVTNITHGRWFPHGSQYEIPGGYYFQEPFLKKYLTTMDRLLQNKSQPIPSSMFNPLFMLRAGWSAVEMQKYPRLQQWRHQQYLELAKRYLEGQNLYEYWFSKRE